MYCLTAKQVCVEHDETFKSSVNNMPPAKEDQIDYERRAQRMIQRWAGVRGPVRSDEERNNVTEIFTDRLQLSESREESFVLGTFKSIYKN